MNLLSCFVHKPPRETLLPGIPPTNNSGQNILPKDVDPTIYTKYTKKDAETQTRRQLTSDDIIVISQMWPDEAQKLAELQGLVVNFIHSIVDEISKATNAKNPTHSIKKYTDTLSLQSIHTNLTKALYEEKIENLVQILLNEAGKLSRNPVAKDITESFGNWLDKNESAAKNYRIELERSRAAKDNTGLEVASPAIAFTGKTFIYETSGYDGH